MARDTQHVVRRSKASAPRLGANRAKRGLNVGGEPDLGSDVSRPGTLRRFTIQQRAATRLHYELRLEIDGVFHSWAVPTGLPTAPGEKILAVEVEDHPLENGSFEEGIPTGGYGAGTVIVWDRGHYTVSGPSPEMAFRKGKIHFALVGEKAVGEWTLVRIQPRPEGKKTNWLLIRNRAPDHPLKFVRKARARSAGRGRSLEEIAQGNPVQDPEAPREKRAGVRSRKVEQPQRKTLKSAQLAGFVAPMKALSVDEIPPGDWRLEIKFDGYRAIAALNEGKVAMWSRNQNSLVDDYPEVVKALGRILCASAVIDGEIVALDPQGHSRFQLLQNRDTRDRPPIVYYVFDLLHHDGRSLLNTPIEERQLALQSLVGRGWGALQLSPVFKTSPAKLLAEVKANGLEGIIAKTAGSAYQAGQRSGAWLKCKVQNEQEFVIGGFTPPKNSRAHFGAVLIGYYEGGALRYAGKVGSGFNTAQLASLHKEFLTHPGKECPFSDLPATRRSRFGTGMTASVMKTVTWLAPKLVAQIRFTEWTKDGSLRHPVFLGLRRDKSAGEVGRENGKAIHTLK